MKLLAAVLTLFTVIPLAACVSNPAADGRYATHDHGNNNRP
jgi:hypothetical protein